MRVLRLSDMYVSEPANEQVQERIIRYHLDPLNFIAQHVHIDHVACYRSKLHEARNGRRPKNDTEFPYLPLSTRTSWSQHTFEKSEKCPGGLGACDLSSRNLLYLSECLVAFTDYTRFAYYPSQNFVHCDYANDGEPLFFNHRWVRITEDEYFEQIYKRTL